ncbi:hypothetical protein Droror1_Dr00000578 [Drosera rotundifolia]
MFVYDGGITLEFPYCEKFVREPKDEYVCGWVDQVPDVDPDRLSVLVLVEMQYEFYLRRTNKEGPAVAKFWFVGSEGLLPCNNDEHFIYCLGHLQVGYPFIIYANLVTEEAIQSVTPDAKVRSGTQRNFQSSS